MARTIEVEIELGSRQALKTLNDLESAQEQLIAQLKNTEVGTAEYKRLQQQLKTVGSEVKNLELGFEALDKEQRAAALVDAFSGLAGAVGAVSSAFIAFGVESEAIDEAEKKLLGVIGVVSGLREVSDGLVATSKLLGNTLTTAFTTATGAINLTRVALAGLGIGAVIFAVTKLVEVLGEENEALKANQEELAKSAASYDKLVVAINKANEEETRRAKLAIAQAELEGKSIEQITEIQKKSLIEQQFNTATQLDELTKLRAKIRDTEIAELKKSGKTQEEAQRIFDQETIKQQEALNKRIADLILEQELLEINSQKRIQERNKKAAEEAAKRAAARKKETTERRLDEVETGKALEQSISLEDKFTKKIQEGTVLRIESYEEEADAREARLKRLRQAEQDAFAEDVERAKQRIDELAAFGRTITSNVRNFQEQNAELQQIALKNSFEQGLITEEEYLKRSDELNKKAFEQNKNVSIAEAIISTIQGGVNAFSSTLKIDPTGITGGILASLALAAGFAQVNAIRNTTYESPNSGVTSFNNTTGNISTPNRPQFATTGQIGFTGAETTQESPFVLKTYVLAGDVTNAQNANRTIKQLRTL